MVAAASLFGQGFDETVHSRSTHFRGERLPVRGDQVHAVPSDLAHFPAGRRASTMTDIFISYANSDRERAREIANELSARGWSVWWDRKIRAGQTFDEVIERELDTANYIVVLWSAASVASEWVKNEAAVAAQRGVLVPVLLDNVKIPLEFRRRHTADLTGWNGDPSHGGLQALFEALEGARPQVATAPASVMPPKRPAWHLRPWMAAGATGFVLGCVLTYLVVGNSADSGKTVTQTRDAAATARPELSAPTRQGTKASLPKDLSTSYKGVFLDVVGFEKAGELTTLEWILRNTSDQPIVVCSQASEARLIDQISGESWRALHNGGPAAGCQRIPEGGQSGAWAKFKLPALENRRFALSLPTLNKAPELPLPQVSSK
jgi:hypothetical protein